MIHIEDKKIHDKKKNIFHFIMVRHWRLPYIS